MQSLKSSKSRQSLLLLHCPRCYRLRQFRRQEELEQQQEDKLNLEEKYASTEEQVTTCDHYLLWGSGFTNRVA